MWRECVVVNATQRLFGKRRRVERNVTAFAKDGKTQGSQVVETKDVIGMAMGIEDGIDSGELIAQGLLAEVRPGIDQHNAVLGSVVPLQQN